MIQDHEPPPIAWREQSTDARLKCLMCGLPIWGSSFSLPRCLGGRIRRESFGWRHCTASSFGWSNHWTLIQWSSLKNLDLPIYRTGRTKVLTSILHVRWIFSTSVHPPVFVWSGEETRRARSDRFAPRPASTCSDRKIPTERLKISEQKKAALEL